MRMPRLAMIDDWLMVRALMIEERRLGINNRHLDAPRADHADDRLMAYADDALFHSESPIRLGPRSALSLRFG